MEVLYFDGTTVLFASSIWYQSIISILKSTEVILVVDSKIRTIIINQNLANFRNNLLGGILVSVATNKCKRNNTGEMGTLGLLGMGMFVIHPVLYLYGELYKGYLYIFLTLWQFFIIHLERTPFLTHYPHPSIPSNYLALPPVLSILNQKVMITPNLMESVYGVILDNRYAQKGFVNKANYLKDENEDLFYNLPIDGEVNSIQLLCKYSLDMYCRALLGWCIKELEFLMTEISI